VYRIPVLIFLCGILRTAAPAQCSDAGVCIIGSAHSESAHRIGIAYAYGQGDKRDGINYHSTLFDAEVRLTEGTDLLIQLPYTRTDGPLGSTNGIGDLTLLANQNLLTTQAGRLRFQVGAKCPTGESNAGNLPQSYQPGLGTTDLLLGISYETEPWLFATGYQRSRGRSDNAVTRLKRGDDLFARTGYRLSFPEFTLGAELLAIQRLDVSSVLDPSPPVTGGGELFVSIPGSDQFQMNLLTTASLPISPAFSISATGAFALLKREINVDGLTRGLTLSLGMKFSP
jgi:hypothetical protein